MSFRLPPFRLRIGQLVLIWRSAADNASGYRFYFNLTTTGRWVARASRITLLWR